MRADWLAPVVVLAVLLGWTVRAWSAPPSGEEPALVAPAAGGGTPVGLSLPDPSTASEVTVGEWRCLTREEWADRVLSPLRDLRTCRATLDAERGLTTGLRVGLDEAIRQRDEARERVDQIRRRRWRWVAAGALAGVAVSAGTVWVGVAVVGAR